jgi:hypothetical protein
MTMPRQKSEGVLEDKKSAARWCIAPDRFVSDFKKAFVTVGSRLGSPKFALQVSPTCEFYATLLT